jgi:hypothetical protein
MRIFLAALCPGGIVSVNHYKSVMETVVMFREELPELRFSLGIIATSMNSFAHNALASKVLNDPTFSHVLFINGDTALPTQLLVKMILFNKPVVGCVLPDTTFDYKKFHTSRLAIDHAQVARYLATGYVGGDQAFVTAPGPGGDELEFINGFVRVNYASAGLLLIRRDVLEVMKARFPELWLDNAGPQYRDTGLEGGVLQCFEGFQGPDGVFVRDDAAFCRRWVEGCGGEIWACVDEPVARSGDEPFLGHYLLKMKQEGIIVLSDAASPRASAPAT